MKIIKNRNKCSTPTEVHAQTNDPSRLERIVKNIPMQKIGSVEDIAKALVWLLSDDACYVDAEILKVAGGL